MEKKQFFEEVLKATQEQIPAELKGIVKVEIAEVLKNNDEKLNGIRMSIEGNNMMPTLYLEDFFEAYAEGISIEEIANTIIEVCTNAFKNPPPIYDFSFEYDEIKDKLIVELIDGDMNQERLSDLVYKEIKCGLVMVPYVTIRDLPIGAMRTAVTKDMVQKYNYDVDELMDTAFVNTIDNFKPVFMESNFETDFDIDIKTANPMEDTFKIDRDGMLYLLTNSEGLYGATVFFYPGVAEKIGQILGKDYYVLPSSVHEMMIVPKVIGVSPKGLKLLVKDANHTVVDRRDLLSDKVFYYSRKNNELIAF